MNEKNHGSSPQIFLEKSTIYEVSASLCPCMSICKNRKKFAFEILSALRKDISDKDSKDNILTYEDYKIDIEKRNVELNSKSIKLTTLEFDLLLLFLQNKGKCFSRDEILQSVWGPDYFGTDRVVDDLIRRVRKKLSKVKIEAVYGYGYRLL